MTAALTKSENPALADLLEAGNHAIQVALRTTPLKFAEFVTALETEVAVNPQLAECVKANPKSVMNCLLHAAQLGLRPGKVHKHFALIPRKLKHGGLTCTSIVEYRGYLDLGHRAECLEGCAAEIVYKGEKFSYDRAQRKIEHVWDRDTDVSADKIVAAYAVADVVGWKKPVVVVMTRAQIEKRRARSLARNDGPWVTDYAAMCRKTVIRALFESGFVPLNSNVQAALVQAERDEDEPEEIKQADATVRDAEPEVGGDADGGDQPTDTTEALSEGSEEVRAALDARFNALVKAAAQGDQEKHAQILEELDENSNRNYGVPVDGLDNETLARLIGKLEAQGR